MNRLVVFFVLCSVTAAPAAQQPTPRFEVTSVKRNYVPDVLQRSRINLAPGRYTAKNQTLRDIIKHAYSVIDSQIIGGPDWMNSTEFNVEATAPGASTEEIRPMVQRLLADRFRLAVTKQTRTRPIYRLVRARQDGKLPKGLTADSCPDTSNPERPPTCNTVAGGPSLLMGMSISMERLAKLLSSFPYTEVDRIVVDATGLPGTYRFSMQFAATREYYGLRANNDPNLSSFMTALQEQVGLKLEPARGPVEVLLIDSVERPTPD